MTFEEFKGALASAGVRKLTVTDGERSTSRAPHFRVTVTGAEVVFTFDVPGRNYRHRDLWAMILARLRDLEPDNPIHKTPIE